VSGSDLAIVFIVLLHLGAFARWWREGTSLRDERRKLRSEIDAELAQMRAASDARQADHAKLVAWVAEGGRKP
jgi:hypothetical protein